MPDPDVRRIIAVDDEAMWRKIIGNELEGAGVEHALAETAEEAAEMLKAGGFAGVITDGLEGRWPEVVEAAEEVGARAVLLSGDYRQIDAATERGVETQNKGEIEPGFFDAVISSMLEEPEEPRSVLDSVFSTEDSVSADLEAITMGFEDFSDDETATQVLRGLTDRQRSAVHRFSLGGPVSALQHLKYIVDLVDGYHARDPERASEGAFDEVLAAIDESRAYFEVISEQEYMPTLVLVKPKDMPKSDTERQVWVVRATEGEEKGVAKRFSPDFDVVESFVREPSADTVSLYKQTGFNLIGSSFAIMDRNNFLR